MNGVTKTYTVDDWQELCEKLTAISEENAELKSAAEQSAATIESLNAKVATLEADKASLNDKLTADEATIAELKANKSE